VIGPDESWLDRVEASVERFAHEFKTTYAKTDRQLAAMFEIGCFHLLIDFYAATYEVTAEQLDRNGDFSYLTTPAGNPANFSFVALYGEDGAFEIRQQVRVTSHLHPDIAFTPDLLVLRRGSRISERLDENYAGGKKRYFSVDSSEIVAVHECKSLNPFPELLVSFIGFVAAAHEYFDDADGRITFHEGGRHLAPTLFVGGSARGLHLRMIRAMRSVLPINVIVGVHSGTENLFGVEADVRRFDFVDATAASSAEG
jgi:hypothetical protein